MTSPDQTPPDSTQLDSTRLSPAPIKRTPLHQATVTAVHDLTARMRRVTVTAPTLAGIDFYPAQDVELVLVDATGRRVKRRYTIRHAHNRSEGIELDLDVLLHGKGPGSQWAAHAEVGSTVQFFGPRGKLRLTEAATSLFVGDESSLPAIATLLEALGAQQHGHAIIEVDSTADELDLAELDTGDLDTGSHTTGGHTRHQIDWVHRNGHPAGTAELLRDRLNQNADHAYLLGESRSVVALRTHLVELGMPSEQIFTKGYWNVHTGR